MEQSPYKNIVTLLSGYLRQLVYERYKEILLESPEKDRKYESHRFELCPWKVEGALDDDTKKFDRMMDVT